MGRRVSRGPTFVTHRRPARVCARRRCPSPRCGSRLCAPALLMEATLPAGRVGCVFDFSAEPCTEAPVLPRTRPSAPRLHTSRSGQCSSRPRRQARCGPSPPPPARAGALSHSAPRCSGGAALAVYRVESRQGCRCLASHAGEKRGPSGRA